jgi:hypothetical protein
MRFLGMLLVAASASLVTTNAQAYDGFYSGLPWFGYGYSGSLYGLGYVPVPPYFALHPPVQYSRPVARPYGRSPFAARAVQRRVVVETSRPQMVLNPFAGSASLAQTTSSPPKSRMIVNPYYKSPETKAESVPPPTPPDEAEPPPAKD